MGTRDWDYSVVELIRAVDGDTYDLTLEKEIDFGFRLIERKRWSARFRLLHADAWEHNEAGGSAATAFAREWIAARIESGALRGQTFKGDSFGRWLIDLYDSGSRELLSTSMLNAGHLKTESKWNK